MCNSDSIHSVKHYSGSAVTMDSDKHSHIHVELWTVNTAQTVANVKQTKQKLLWHLWPYNLLVNIIPPLFLWFFFYFMASTFLTSFRFERCRHLFCAHANLEIRYIYSVLHGCVFATNVMFTVINLYLMHTHSQITIILVHSASAPRIQLIDFRSISWFVNGIPNEVILLWSMLLPFLMATK